MIVGPGSPQAMLDGIRACAPGGTVLFFTPAPPGTLLEVEQHHLYFNEISLVSSYSCGPYDTRDALDLIARGLHPGAGPRHSPLSPGAGGRRPSGSPPPAASR